MGTFESSDILQIAIRIEENGIHLYRHAARIAKEKEAKDVFEFLASQEEQHKEVFKKLLSKVEIHKSAELYPGEYCAYLKDYVDDNIVFDREQMKHDLSALNDTLSIVNFAIRRELDSILYYHEVKRLISEDKHKMIEEIIDEERKHFKTLSELKTQIKSRGSEE